MIYQRSTQKYKWKAISILHEKAKLISAQRGPHTTQRVGKRTVAHGAAHAREVAHGEEARARCVACDPRWAEISLAFSWRIEIAFHLYFWADLW